LNETLTFIRFHSMCDDHGTDWEVFRIMYCSPACFIAEGKSVKYFFSGKSHFTE